MVQYLTLHHTAPLNQLLQAVLKDLQCPYLIAGCKALGIIDKIVTGPFWRCVQSSTVSILEMSDIYTKMKQKFDEWGNDSQVVIENQVFLFEDYTNTTDEVALHIFESSEEDSMVQEILQILFKSFSLTIQRLLIDHLPGGEFHGVTDPSIVLETESVPKTNVTPERNFAVLDRLLSEKPNATYIALESLLLFSHNKTATWLHSKSIEERERLLQAARTMTAVHRTNFRMRREEIEARRIEAMEKRERELQKKKARELKEKEDLTKKVQQIGLLD